MDLKLQLGKFYLANAGFPVANALLIPYQGVWYHLAKWGHADLQYTAIIINIALMVIH